MARKIGIVVQRYGLEISGGAEYHARLIAERLARYFAVEVFTTAAHDYVTWADHYANAVDVIHGIPVNRFRVKKPRDPERFGRIQKRVVAEEHTYLEELDWLDEEGPLAPALLQALDRRQDEFDYLLFFSYRYYHSYQGVRRFAPKAILVPTAEHDEVIYLRLFRDLFRLPAAIVYNSVEEMELIQRLSGNSHVAGDVVGVGSEIPASFDADGARRRFGIDGPFFIYIGRLDENKGIPELFRYYLALQQKDFPLTLVLAGSSRLPIPEHPRIRYLGFVSDEDKFSLLAGAEFLIIPSQYESLSMVALEAWAMGKPVVANGCTEVLRGQCRRSNAGLWYSSYAEFSEVVRLLHGDENLRQRLAENGRRFFTENYSWPVIDGKYLRLIERLDARRQIPEGGSPRGG